MPTIAQELFEHDHKRTSIDITDGKYLIPRFRHHSVDFRIDLTQQVGVGGNEGEVYRASFNGPRASRYDYLDNNLVAKIFKPKMKPAVDFKTMYDIVETASSLNGMRCMPEYVARGSYYHHMGKELHDRARSDVILMEYVHGEGLDDFPKFDSALRNRLIESALSIALAIDAHTEGKQLLDAFSHDDVIISSNNHVPYIPICFDPPIRSRDILLKQTETPDVQAFAHVLEDTCFVNSGRIRVIFSNDNYEEEFDTFCYQEELHDRGLQAFLLELFRDHYRWKEAKKYTKEGEWTTKKLIFEFLKIIPEHEMKLVRNHFKYHPIDQNRDDTT